LIGVIPRSDQLEAAEEFFQLFKTPWEFYRPGRSYDVLVVTADEIPQSDARIILAYGATAKSTDVSCGITARLLYEPAILNDQGVPMPIYGDLAALENSDGGTIRLTADAGAVGIAFDLAGHTLIRLGFDLFEEVKVLLSTGQPAEHAHVPTLDIHIRLLREWILSAGVALLEIPPVPAGHSFTVCLTHDIDFAGIRNHRFDHTMWGFLYRSTLGAVRRLLCGRIQLRRLLQTWRAAASLPFVYLGLAKDFWEPFQWYLEVEEGLGATYFLIPFKGYAGERVPSAHASRRAAAYDLDSLSHSIAALTAGGCELGVHGIDAWYSVAKGREERARIEQVSGTSCSGIRIHWLLRDENTVSALEESGYSYDSTVGYNETIGYRAGTSQVFQPRGAKRLLELPLHIQDGALFYPDRMDLSESEAEMYCGVLIQNAKDLGGMLTLLWHDRSHGPERFWGDFYANFVRKLKSSDPWFATARQAVNWSRKRREARFESVGDGNGVRVLLHAKDKEPLPFLNLRVYRPSMDQADTQGRPGSSRFRDVPWDGTRTMEFDRNLHRVPEPSVEFSAL